MPITPRNVSELTGAAGLPEVYINKNTGAVVNTSFAFIVAAIHINTAGAVVADADAAGTAAMTLTVAATGTLLVFGYGQGGAAVTLA